MRILLALGMALVLLLSGCSEKLARQTNLTDADLFARGQKNVERKKYGNAAEAFQVLLERFPASPFAGRAQFLLAVSRMETRENIEAEVAFDDFLRLYPADPRVPEALYLKGKLLSRQVQIPERDQSKTRDAIKAYSLFLEKAPGSPLVPEVAAKIRDLRNRLALHEADVTRHYIRRKLYESAEVRSRRALAEYPDVPATPELLSLLAQALEKEGKTEASVQARRSLAEKFPGYGGKKR